ncbi:MAG TPA: DUF885 domain-containing protein [Fulvivirga sp.]|nr:DUF885 domain-containing protein [Fulvivirga sp.]
MKNVLLIALAVVFFMSCKTEPKQEEAPIEFSQFLQNYNEERLALYPLDATFAGDTRFNDQFPNSISEGYRGQLKDFYSKYLTGLQNYDRESFNENDQMSYDVLKWECDINLEGLTFPTNLRPIDQMWSVNLVMGQLASGSSAQPFKTVEDYNNWLKRVSQFIVWGDTAIANMKKGIKTWNVLPTSLIKKVIPQIESLAKGTVEDHLFYSPVKMFPENFTDAEKEKLTVEYEKMVSDQIIPLFTRMSKFLNEEYLPAGRSTSGISALKNGDGFYKHQIKLYTTTEMTADEVFELGKSEVARILSEMEKVKNEVGFKGDIKSFFNYVRNKKELMPFNTADEVLANFDAIHERMKPQLEKLFDKVPKTPFEIKRTESFREASASAEYNQGSLDGTRPGIFYVPVPDAKKYNTYSDESLFLHEAIPGHHYQISLQQENESLPEFRRTLWYSAYGEGWALYSESLGKELGLYTDPYQYFGMLGAEMHRAVRLVVDAGMHSKGWTREQAIQYSLDNEAESEAGITSEIERYMANPGQALSYKIGQLKIIELRKRAEATLGEKFDIREFHNVVLGTGCVPLELLEAKINSWIAANK